MCVQLQDGYLAFYSSKTNEDKNTKFYTQYQTSAQIIFLSFDKNWETGSGVEHTGNETGSEYLKNGSNDFLQIREINTFFHII